MEIITANKIAKISITDIESNYEREKSLSVYMYRAQDFYSNFFDAQKEHQTINPIHAFIQASKRRYKVLYITDRLYTNEFGMILANYLSKISLRDLLTGEIQEDVWPKLVDAFANINDWESAFIRIETAEEFKALNLASEENKYRVLILDVDSKISNLNKEELEKYSNVCKLLVFREFDDPSNKTTSEKE